MNKLNVKIIAIITAICCLLISLPVYAISDGTDIPEITISSSSGYPGDEVIVNISISKNPGIAYLKLNVGYDSTLTLKSAENKSVLSGTFTTSESTTVKPYVLQWMNASNSNENGIIATVSFQISNQAPTGAKTLTISVAECYNASLKDIGFTSSNGTVTVFERVCAHTNTTLTGEKTATCCENGYTGDTYCADCGVKIADGTVILATGNHTDADGKWETNGTEHWHTCYFGTQFDLATHTGGTSTCTEKAICTVCGVEYGEYGAHGETEVRNAEEVTCCEDGYTGDTYCKDCNAKMASGSVIPATGNHIDADDNWESNGTQHWHTCYYGTQFDIASHTGGTATCTEKAKCSVCGAEYGNYTEHTLTHHDPVAPDYENNGNIEYWTCDECGKYFTDSEGRDEIFADDVIIAKLVISKYQFIDGEVIIEAPAGAIPEGSLFDVQKIVPPPAEVVEKVKEQMGSSSEVLAYYEIRLSDTNGTLIIHLDGEITIKTKMPEQYVGSKCVRILQEDETGKLIVMESWWENDYLCYKTDWLEIYN